MPGSVSKYCLQRSPVPTIVVRPTSKRTKKKMKRQQEAGRNVYGNILTKAQTTGGATILAKTIGGDFETRESEKEAREVQKAIGSPRKGILRNKNYGGPLARVTSSGEIDEDDEPAQRFALPIGFLTTESAPRADLAMQNPLIQALGEAWDDDSPRNGSRSQSPMPPAKKSDPESALGDSDDDLLGVPKIIGERRPSTRSQTAWLDNILRKPEKAPPGRSLSRERN